MKRLLLIGLVLLMACMTADAVPAKPVKKTVTLRDGSTVELTLQGDEFFKFYAGSDGFAYRESMGTYERMSMDNARKEWKARRADAGNVRRSQKRAAGEPARLTGNERGMVLLVQFADVKFAPEHTQAVFQDFFNKENYTDYGMTGSVRDYFREQSYGKFVPEFDVVGPLTAANDMAYYGRHSGNNSDSYVQELVKEACLQADPLVNFADYDWDGDGEADLVYMVYAGYSEAQDGAPETIWPHRGYLAIKQLSLQLDGVKIDEYACSSELRGSSGSELDGIGTACHEFSHCLGLPDTYDTSYSGGYGMQNWDLMGNGSYNNASRTPAGYTSYERMFLGWLTPTVLSGDMTQVKDMKALVDAPEAYILYNDANRNEYYLLENRQPRGFDSALPGHGLLVLHVDYNRTAWWYNEVNIAPNHQRLSVIAADNNYIADPSQMAGDAYPGTANNTSLTNFTTPASTLYHLNFNLQKLMSKPIDGITESEDGLISFWVGRPQLTTPDPDDAKATGDGNSFTISWPEVEGAKGYQVELTESGIVPSNVADALEQELDFHEFVTDTIGTKDISLSFLDYGWWGWFGYNLYTSPNKLLMRTEGGYGFVGSRIWNMPKSGEITLVIGAAPVKQTDDPVRSIVDFCHYDSLASPDAADYTQEISFWTKDDIKVYHFQSRKELYFFEIIAYLPLYLKYMAVYNGTWSEEELGLTGANARVARRTIIAPVIYDTNTNSYTYTPVSQDCKYRYRVRAFADDNRFSAWSSEKVYIPGATAVSGILLPPGAPSPTVYDLQGRSMGTNPSALPKGIYIVNGKKMVKSTP